MWDGMVPCGVVWCGVICTIVTRHYHISCLHLRSFHFYTALRVHSALLQPTFRQTVRAVEEERLAEADGVALQYLAVNGEV